MRFARDNPDGRRGRAGVAHGRLHRLGRLQIVRIGQALGDDGGLERHRAFTGGEGVLDLFG